MNEASVQHAVQLFKQHFPDFVDFEHPGTAFEENENRYKQDILAAWRAEDGSGKLRQLAMSGRGIEAFKFMRKVTGLGTMRNNLLRHFDMDKNLESDDSKLCGFS